MSDFSNWITYFKLFKAIKKENPTVVHIAGELGLSEFFLYFFRKKMVQTVHDPLMHSGEKNWLSEIRRNFSFKLASKLVLLNENQKRDFGLNSQILYSRIVKSAKRDRATSLMYGLSVVFEYEKQGKADVGRVEVDALRYLVKYIY